MLTTKLGALEAQLESAHGEAADWRKKWVHCMQAACGGDERRAVTGA